MTATDGDGGREDDGKARLRCPGVAMLPPYVHYAASHALALEVGHDRVTLYLVRLHEPSKGPQPWMRAEMDRQDLVWLYTAIGDILTTLGPSSLNGHRDM